MTQDKSTKGIWLPAAGIGLTAAAVLAIGALDTGLPDLAVNFVGAFVVLSLAAHIATRLGVRGARLGARGWALFGATVAVYLLFLSVALGTRALASTQAVLLVALLASVVLTFLVKATAASVVRPSG
jgi:hypothetical protein